MLTLSQKRCGLFLLSASLFWGTCVGWITLCSITQNGTSVPAKLGAQASVSFCVYSNYKVYNYVLIKQSKHIHGWYPKPGQENVRLLVQIGQQINNKVTINITINNVNYEDFSDVFTVTANTNGEPKYDVTFWFKLLFEDDVTTPTEHPEMPPIIQLTSLSTRRQTTLTPAVTTQIPSCHSQQNSECPEMWYPVDDERCLKVLASNTVTPPEQLCQAYGAHVPTESDMTSGMISCLTHLLTGSSIKFIPLKTSYVNVVTMRKSNSSVRNYRVACLLEKQPMKEKPSQASYTEATITEQIDPVYIWPPLLLLTLLCLVIVGVLIYRKIGAKNHPTTKLLTTPDSANDDNEKVMYANLKELETGVYAQINDVDTGKESSLKNDETTVVPSDQTRQDSDRFTSEEGLVYLTVAQTINTDSKKQNQAMTKSKRNKQKPEKPYQDHGESVEYTSLNFDNTVHETTEEGEVE